VSNFSTDGVELSFEWYGVKGVRYQVEYCTDLGSAAWVPAGGIMTGADAPLYFSDPLVAGAKQLFYRVVIIQP
jgi:hypothetical protein